MSKLRFLHTARATNLCLYARRAFLWQAARVTAMKRRLHKQRLQSTYTYLYIYAKIYMYTYIYKCVCVCVCVCVKNCIKTKMRVYIYTLCLCIIKYVYIYIWWWSESIFSESETYMTLCVEEGTMRSSCEVCLLITVWKGACCVVAHPPCAGQSAVAPDQQSSCLSKCANHF